MSRTARFFDIIQILRQAKHPVIAQDLAEKLEVNIRTIYRDIASLQASGIPITGEAGIGYVMQSGFDLPPLMFSQEELEAISVGLSLLGRSGDSGLIEAANNVAAKIADVSFDKTRVNSLHVSTWHQIPEATISAQKLRELIRDEVEIRITYKDLKGDTTTRDIKPIALFYYIDVILLVAWCGMRNDFRHFRVDLIQKWENTGKRFKSESIVLREAWVRTQEQ